MATETIRVYGLDSLLRKLDPAKIAGRPARNLLNRWRFSTEAEAKRGAPVWRGHLRRNITSEIDDGPLPRAARVGTNLDYAKPVEYGTGLLSDAPDSAHRRYFPPPAALDAWAIAHGFHAGSRRGALEDAASSPGTYGLLVSQAIWKKGGTKPRRYLRDAAEASAKRLPGYVAQMAAEIEAQAGNG